MKKSAVLAELERIKRLAESEPDTELVETALIELLVTYTNDPQIREAVDAIPF